MDKKDVLLGDVLSALTQFENSFPLDDFRAGGYAQHPFATLLTCCDARVPSTLLGDPFNRVFCVENIGNQVRNSQGSIEYGLLHLHTPLMFVAGHTDCGAIKAASADYQEEPFPLKKGLDTVKKSLEECAAVLEDEDTARRYALMAELNVDRQIECLMEDPPVKQLFQEGKLTFIGLMVDLHNQYGEGYGKVYITNMNGIRDIDQLNKEPLLKNAPGRIKRLSKS